MYGDIEHYAMHRLQHGKNRGFDGISRAQRTRRRNKPVNQSDSEKPCYRNGVKAAGKYACL